MRKKDLEAIPLPDPPEELIATALRKIRNS